MKLLGTLALLWALFFSDTATATRHPEDSCGGTLTASASGISYKSFIPANRNERCVWFIQARNATLYHIQVIMRSDCSNDATNQTNPNNLIISGLSNGYNTTHYYPYDDNWIAIGADVVMVTFYTTHNVSSQCRGFFLRYLAYDIDYPSLNNGQPHHFKVRNGSSLSYPENLGKSQYSNGQLATFLFGSNDNLYHHGQPINVCYRRKGLEGDSCFDHVTLYKFGVHTHWEMMQRICGNVATQQFQSNDLILAVFESDNKLVGAGFQFTNANNATC